MKRFIAAIIAASCITGTFAFSAQDKGDKVTVIVEVKGDAVLEAEAAREMGFKLFSETDEAAEIESDIRLAQAEVQSDIKQNVDRKAEIIYTYTYVFNGFSMEVYESDVEKIKALPTVENVYISKTYELYDNPAAPTVYLDSGCTMMNTDYMHDNGYTGKGMVIAIVDGGFDTNHENFKGAIENPRFSKSDIENTIATGRLSINALGGNATVNRVYHSEKIPYAYNYYNGNSDTYDPTCDHGQHVAGIAAGNNGTDPDGNKFVGTAPDAQLLLMSCGEGGNIAEVAAIAAIDDAVKLGADVINASYGANYNEGSAAEEKAINTAVKAGVLFSAAAGNEARGYNEATPKAENIDYSSSGTPNRFTASTAVASADNTANSQNKDVKISSFSSWNTDSTLELKPEITAPGGNIYSSVNDDKYGVKGGTSMAAPHMTGAAALMKEYITKNTSKYGTVTNYARLIENLIMTSADVIMQDTENGIPYSPRLQGAGMVNLEKAAKTPVILLGDTYTVGGIEIEKSRISLKEIDDTFELKFKAHNLTDTAVTYDSITMTIITDDADEDGFVSDMKKLTFNAVLPESVTVPAKGETEITIPVTLDKTELDENMEVFKNGFFIDGYVFLENTTDTEISQISMPFMGFYGGWDSAPALDKPYFSGDSILGGTYMYTTSNRNANGSYASSRSTKIMGTNWFTTGIEEDIDDYESEDYVGYSPNNDNAADIPSAVAMPLRRLGKTDCAIYDEAGTELLRKTDMENANQYFYAEKFSETYLYFSQDEINALPDGDYTFKIYSGFIRSERELNESVEFKFYLDREKPMITQFEKSEDGKTLSVTATDNRHIMGFVLSGTRNGEEFTEAYPVKGLTEAEHIFNIEGIDEGSLSVEAVDYAQNSTTRSEAELDYYFQGTSGSNYIFVSDNTTGHTINAALTMALYRDGNLVGLSSKNETIPDGTAYLTFNLNNATGYDTIKLFVLDSLENMEPLYEAFEF